MRDYFHFRNCQVDQNALCIANPLHFELDKRGAGERRLITWNGSPQVARATDIGSIPLEGKYLADWVANYMAAYLRDKGVNIPLGDEDRLEAPLVSAYELLTCLSYADTISRTGVRETCLVTKSAEVIYAFKGLLAPSERKKSAGRFQEQFNVSDSELESGIFSVVKLVREPDGYYLKQHRLNTRNKGFVVPMYSIMNWAGAVASFLQSDQAIISYTDDAGRDHELLTTLDPRVLGVWMNMKPTDAFYKLKDDWKTSVFNAVVPVPDSGYRHNFVSLPLLGIRKIEKYNSPLT